MARAALRPSASRCPLSPSVGPVGLVASGRPRACAIVCRCHTHPTPNALYKRTIPLTLSALQHKEEHDGCAEPRADLGRNKVSPLAMGKVQPDDLPVHGACAEQSPRW
eukprot:1191591-Prorocentrum_minimum.AAC.5